VIAFVLFNLYTSINIIDHTNAQIHVQKILHLQM